MDEAEQKNWNMRAWEIVQQAARAEYERQEQLAARQRCDQCLKPKHLREDEVRLANGLQIGVHTTHCENPPPSCTASVCSIIHAVPTEVANRMAEALTAHPEMVEAGVTYLIHGGPPPARYVLEFCVPVLDQVLKAAGLMCLEEFQDTDCDGLS